METSGLLSSLKKLNKAEQHGAVVAFVEGKLQQYDPKNNPKLNGATSYEEYKAAEATYRMDFFKQLGDINPALVHKHTNTKQKEKESTAYNNWNATREAAIKEEEAQKYKDELLVLWTDFFKPQHLESIPNLHDTFWQAAKLCSACKAEVSEQHSQELMDAVEEIHNMFWAAKGREVPWIRAS